MLLFLLCGWCCSCKIISGTKISEGETEYLSSVAPEAEPAKEKAKKGDDLIDRRFPCMTHQTQNTEYLNANNVLESNAYLNGILFLSASTMKEEKMAKSADPGTAQGDENSQEHAVELTSSITQTP